MKRNSLGVRHDVFGNSIPQHSRAYALQSANVRRKQGSVRSVAAYKITQQIFHAGCEDSINVQGVLNASIALGVFFSVICGAVGFVITPGIGYLGLLVGLCMGIYMPYGALKQEALLRNSAMEQGLSEFIEIICVGLHAGMTFDRALGLYCTYFTGEFSKRLLWCYQAWSIGITTRKNALRNLAAEYNSKILEQVFECVIRSSTFGSPLADNLETLSVQARMHREAKAKEKAMKVPVKMMIPIGTLLLPSMLLLVLGPALLNLAQDL